MVRKLRHASKPCKDVGVIHAFPQLGVDAATPNFLAGPGIDSSGVLNLLPGPKKSK